MKYSIGKHKKTERLKYSRRKQELFRAVHLERFVEGSNVDETERDQRHWIRIEKYYKLESRIV